ncbi:hypothetical protein SAMN02745195_01745 [Thermoanaerobacter uzonensis DSM 18761]|uniref:Uncharacterized protein n=1 Tax=Thermoanaerobacter uzonensis DSM 18761 TaxID=1123369 RepID=A0A1M4YHX1_9THEO|nr:hypothetical protein [Thermoanaerobacter uzonensis]SHF05395.1 hypothetical protein SAMN02745195_01745 [Thermoanaerobacter uzonensis DSM 18761]
MQQKNSNFYQALQNTSNTKIAGIAYLAQTNTNKNYSGSTTALYKSASASPSVIPLGGSTTTGLTNNNDAITAYTVYSKSGSATPVQTNGSPYPSYLKSASITPYISASTTPVIYNKDGSTTPIAGGSTTPKINIIAGQINGSTTLQNYKIYDKNGQITINQQNVNTVTVLKNFGEGMGDAVVDTLKGVWTIATHPVETAQGIAYAATHPAETANVIKNEAIKIYNDFKTGDANTKSKIAGRIVGEIGLAVVGTKGIDKGVKILKEATVIAGTAKASEAAVDITKAGKAVGVVEKAAVTAVKEVTTQTTEKATFKELREVARFLKESGINDISDRRSIIEAFNPGAKVVKVEKDFKAYRYFGGKAKPRGHWLTDRLLKDPENELALPPKNKAEKVPEWIIPKGTKVLDGTVAPHEKWGRPGGARQIFLPNPEVLKEGKNAWSLKGTNYTK